MNYRVVEGCYTTLIGDGTLGPLVVDTWRRDIPDRFTLPHSAAIHRIPPGDPRVGRGRRSTLFWLNHQLECGTFIEGDVGPLGPLPPPSHSPLASVFLDNERALNIKEARDLLADHGVRIMNYPPYMGHLLDPCDNNFHSEERRRANELLGDIGGRITGPKKMKILLEAYESGSETSIKNYFRRVGLLGNEPAADVISRLVNEGTVKARSKFLKFHKEQLEQFLWKCLLEDTPIIDRPERTGPFWDTLREFLK